MLIQSYEQQRLLQSSPAEGLVNEVEPWEAEVDDMEDTKLLRSLGL